jgi:transmembrane sensor
LYDRDTMLEDLSDRAVQGPEKAREAAAMWLARLGRGLRADEAQPLREWLKDPINRNIVLDMARLWHGPDIIALLSELIPAGPEPMEPRSWRSILFASLKVTVAAGLIAWTVSGETPRLHFHQHWTHLQGSLVEPRGLLARGRYFTDVGERGDVDLPDGTRVTLNTGTHLGVFFSQHLRQVIVPNGEVSFQVAHDPQRPFLVLAGRRRFEALGTNFNLRVLTPDNVELTVTEGNVKVLYIPTELSDTPAEARLHDNMTLDDTTVGALETALLEPGFQFVRKIAANEADTLLAWHQGLVFFKGTPLAQALAELDRYTTTQFVLGDEKLRNVRIDGHFHTGDVDGLLHSLRRDFLIDSRRDTRGRVVLTALARPPQS